MQHQCNVLFCCDVMIVMTTERTNEWMTFIGIIAYWITLFGRARLSIHIWMLLNAFVDECNLSVAIVIEVKVMAGTINKSCNPSSDRSVKPIHSLLFPHAFVRSFVRSFVHRNSISIMHECVMCARAYVCMHERARSHTYVCLQHARFLVVLLPTVIYRWHRTRTRQPCKDITNIYFIQVHGCISFHIFLSVLFLLTFSTLKAPNETKRKACSFLTLALPLQKIKSNIIKLR